jgi:hypothetical protein
LLAHLFIENHFNNKRIILLDFDEQNRTLTCVKLQSENIEIENN